MENINVYHEKQKLQFCLLHALNNLLQEKDSFTRAELDTIADKLVLDSPSRDNKWKNPLSVILKPHHNIITGNYDVNVLISALEGRKYKVIWHDRRKKASSINLAEANLLGIIYNIPVRKLAGLWSGRHWVALRKISNIWYNLDSDFSRPQPFLSENEVEAFLDEIITLDISTNRKLMKTTKFKEADLGQLGKYMVDMLPDDLAFTVFAPCEDSFERVLKLRAIENLVDDKINDTLAIISRVMGFCAVPNHIHSEEVPILKEIIFDSISGYKLYLWRAYNGTMFVNNVMSERVNMRKGEIIVHVMKGVIMDSGFAESFQTDDDQEDV